MSTTTADQMFLDHGSDSFLAEVIGLVKVRRLQIDIMSDLEEPPRDIVRVEFIAEIPDRRPKQARFYALEFGRSYGQALRKVRDKLREEVGR